RFRSRPSWCFEDRDKRSLAAERLLSAALSVTTTQLGIFKNRYFGKPPDRLGATHVTSATSADRCPILWTRRLRPRMVVLVSSSIRLRQPKLPWRGRTPLCGWCQNAHSFRKQERIQLSWATSRDR